jgi:hypothetical protein
MLCICYIYMAYGMGCSIAYPYLYRTGNNHSLILFLGRCSRLPYLTRHMVSPTHTHDTSGTRKRIKH